MKSARLGNLVRNAQLPLKQYTLKNPMKGVEKLSKAESSAFPSVGQTPAQVGKREENYAPLRLLHQREKEYRQQLEEQHMRAKKAAMVTPVARARANPLREQVDLLTQIMRMHRADRGGASVQPSVVNHADAMRIDATQARVQPVPRVSAKPKMRTPLSLGRRSSHGSSSKKSSTSSFGRRKEQERAKNSPLQNVMRQFGTQNVDSSLHCASPAMNNLMSHRQQHIGSQIGRISRQMEGVQSIKHDLMSIDDNLKERISLAKYRLARVETEVGAKPNIEIKPKEDSKPVEHMPLRYDMLNMSRSRTNEMDIAHEQLKKQKLKLEELKIKPPPIMPLNSTQPAKPLPEKSVKDITDRLKKLSKDELLPRMKLPAPGKYVQSERELTWAREKRSKQLLSVKHMKEKQEKWQVGQKRTKQGKKIDDQKDSQNEAESLPKGRSFLERIKEKQEMWHVGQKRTKQGKTIDKEKESHSEDESLAKERSFLERIKEKQEEWQFKQKRMKQGKTNYNDDKSQSAAESSPEGRLFSDLDSFSSQSKLESGSEQDSGQNAPVSRKFRAAAPTATELCLRNDLTNDEDCSPYRFGRD